MSSSSEYSEFSGQKSAEKSTFSQTCSLLSQYIKEKGTFGDLSLGMTCNTEGNGSSEMYRQTATTMNLFPIMEKSDDVSDRNMTPMPRSLSSRNIFPQQAAFGAFPTKEDIPKMANSSVPKNPQMTILYAGQVIVFDDFPADKAKEVMMFASKGSSQSQNTFAPTMPQKLPAFAHNLAKTSVDSTAAIPTMTRSPSIGNNLVQDSTQPPPRPIVQDLPIARKASLHRFLEKRKDRIASRAPYQTSSMGTTPNKADESNSWLGLAAQF
ncbi:Tify domain-containing protein/CCT_2 domain-containing protein [Quillaja saponaria]|uniref:Protein TIFY n=1 Tax=Quillaja saponaria TaxID=32244 RepID=A0AAD7PHN9_QUISA|nr:Tify domain-containing protein/CCT_2 domain-containing protein [Quillaja saponaria]